MVLDTPEKIPKSVQNARDAMAKLGLEVTADNLQKNLDKQTFAAVSQAFRKALSPESKTAYANLRSDAERRAYVNQFILDPEIARTNGFNRTTAIDESMAKATEGWLTREELGGPLWLNSLKNADLLIASKTLPERPHDNAVLAAAGVKAYFFGQHRNHRATGLREEAGVKAACEVKAEEYKAIKDTMHKSATEGSVKRKASNQRVAAELSPAEKKLKAANASRATALRKLKAVVDKHSNEYASRKADIPKLLEKGYPDTMADFMQSKLDAFNTDGKAARELHAMEAVMQTEKSAEKSDEVEASTTRMETMTQSLDAAITAWKKGAAADLKQLVG